MKLKLVIDIQGISAERSAEHTQQHFVFAQCFRCASDFFVGVQCHEIQHDQLSAADFRVRFY